MNDQKTFVALIFLTLQDLFGHRTYRLSIAAVLLLPWLLLIPSSLFLIDIGKVFLDMLFTGLHGWMVAYIFFIAAPMLARDIELGIASIFLTLPMSRISYFGARLLGLMAGMFPLFMAYLISSNLSILWAGHVWQGYVADSLWISGSSGLCLILPPYIALLSVLFLIASRATGAAEIGVFLLGIWILCWSLPPVLDALQNPTVAAKTSPWLIDLLHFIHQLLPDLSSSDISLRLAHQLPLSASQVAGYCLQHLAYAGLAWGSGAWLFSRRDLA